ncbi:MULTISPECIES: alpha/beta fold hydrolase [Dyadobacter]|uniref:Alpha/beta hydrolase n=1 Tax=Dyadobacter chenhuakuii TaxID=2909339 RepID=A0ABY4XLL9_9BACT|nr:MULTISPECIES: alpha/beta hydrolase [Dyadobacter]MCE7071058.1 alpha/beta hydrolase [Dyadobacter sp. CY327]MCF2494160.1 alpha/beta hydrolase [Dyadobacter chenhuakuii]USJ31288.1 alpha/beta hydrolase [Dyadobacter chenhuakuii]
MENTVISPNQYTEEELIKHFPGFTHQHANVNGVELHYVDGGSGTPLICLPGWPQTWFSYHPLAQSLAENFRVIIVDIRGMGSSEKPAAGYDKKNMATDILELVKQLGLTKVHLMGHDIGGMVAMSFAFNYPDFVDKLIVLDGSHPSEGMLQMPLIPPAGTFTEKMDTNTPYAWWMGFNQIKALPEKILEGRFQYLLDWLFEYVMIDASKMGTLDRAVYASAYNEAASIRASNAWYQSFTQDIEDAKHYNPLEMPVLGIGSNVSYNYMKMGLPYVATNVKVEGILDSGHYMFEEQPKKVIELVNGFLAF